MLKYSHIRNAVFCKIKFMVKQEVIIMKKKFKTEIDCAACALKIEDAVAKVEGVEKVAIAFMAQKMTIEFAEGADVDAVTKNVVAAAKKVEPDCEIFVD